MMVKERPPQEGQRPKSRQHNGTRKLKIASKKEKTDLQ